MLTVVWAAARSVAMSGQSASVKIPVIFGLTHTVPVILTGKQVGWRGQISGHLTDLTVVVGGWQVKMGAKKHANLGLL